MASSITIRGGHFIGLLVVLASLTIAACDETPTSPSNVTRERAIEIARQHVSFEPTSIDVAIEGRVWVVTLRRASSLPL